MVFKGILATFVYTYLINVHRVALFYKRGFCFNQFERYMLHWVA